MLNHVGSWIEITADSLPLQLPNILPFLVVVADFFRKLTSHGLLIFQILYLDQWSIANLFTAESAVDYYPLAAEDSLIDADIYFLNNFKICIK